MEKKQENLVKWGLETLEGKHLLPSRTKTLKVDVRTWDSLKSRKKENETFNDVIKELLMERTKAIGDENIKAIKYERKTTFFTYWHKNEKMGFEFEYNDVKANKSDFILDLKIKKVFFGKRILNPSEFFGVDNAHKHYSDFFIVVYLYAVSLALRKEFRAEFQPHQFGVYDDGDYENVALWRQLYYDYSLSEESFKSDIEEPLRLYEEEKPSEEWKRRIQQSLSMKQSTNI